MIINIDKPTGWTSFDVVKKVRKITKHKKVGHGGTLDPFASGVLIIGTEKDTKLLTKITDSDKEYEAEMLLGKTTSTLDPEGKIIDEKPVETYSIKELTKLLKSFIGPQKQIPPMHSAKKHKGKRLYTLARKNIIVNREPGDIVINKLELIKYNEVSMKFRVNSSKGTYIRVLAKDIAEKLGTIGYLINLKRIRVADFSIDSASSIESFEKRWKYSEI